MNWLEMLIAFALGLGMGSWITTIIFRKNCAGTLRVDHSDPNEAPYLFLELKNDGMRRIQTNKSVVFNVRLENYLSRK